MSARGRGRRVGRRALGTLAEQLSERDRTILGSVAAHRFLTTRQIEALHFHDHASPLAAARICRRVLRRLHELCVLAHLERRVGGVRAGSSSYVWCLGPVGDRLLRADAGDGVRLRFREPSATFLDHSLAVADTRLTLLAAQRAGLTYLVTVTLEPDCWRTFLGRGGHQETLRPDLFAITAAGEYEDCWFVEVDLGTESVPTVLRKGAQYEMYRRTGIEQQHAGVFPLVVWVVPNPTRQAKLHEAIGSARGLDPGLFRVVLLEELTSLVAGGTS